MYCIILFNNNCIAVISVFCSYYKAHLFSEANMFDSLPPASNVLASAVVNISSAIYPQSTFGIFTCFDLEFNWPLKYLMAPPYSVRSFIMSSWWVNTLPLFNSIAIQQGVSRSRNINLIARFFLCVDCIIAFPFYVWIQ